MLDEKDLGAIAEMLTKSEAMILGEIDRLESKQDRRFDRIDQEIERLEEIYRMTKNENDTISTLLRIIENLEKRLSEVEKKIA